ncbi:hypothetical protein MTO96_034815 [Rhipicephalus appendiculatus]
MVPPELQGADGPQLPGATRAPGVEVKAVNGLSGERVSPKEPRVGLAEALSRASHSPLAARTEGISQFSSSTALNCALLGTSVAKPASTYGETEKEEMSRNIEL